MLSGKENTLSEETVMPAIPLCVPSVHGNEWTYVKDCLDTNWLSAAGPYVNRFEADFAAHLGVTKAVAVASGTAALHVSLLAADVLPDDEVLVSDLTFIAPVNAIRYVGAWPVLVDADPANWEMSTDRVAEFLERDCAPSDGGLRNKVTGRRIGAILPVHILGHPVDMDPLLEAAAHYGIPIIEDATESLGAMYKDRTVGTIGDIGCFSFNGNKLLTTGGGGMAASNNPALTTRMRHLSTQAKEDPIESVHDAVGFNYRLNNIQAALGCAQLERVEALLAAKRRIAETYDKAFADISGVTPMPRAQWAKSALWMYTVLIDSDAYGMDRRRLMGVMDEANIQTRPLWQPMHMSPVHGGAHCLGGAVSSHLYENAISLPCSADLSTEQQERVIALVRRHGSR